MQLLCAVVNVYQQKIIKKQVLDEVILVETLLVSHQKILDLERCQLSYHVNIIAAALGKQDIL